MGSLMNKCGLIAAFFLAPTLASAADFALVQGAAPTSATTQNLTSSGFGTPKCALFWTTTGTVNGTVATHGMLAVGGTDGTRSYTASMMDESAANPSDSDEHRSTTAALLTQVSTDQSVDGTANFNAWVTDGVQLDWTDPPPSAYLVNALLVGGTGVSNCYVGNAATPTTVDTATDVTAPGFEPDLVIVWGAYASTSGNLGLGFVVNDGSNTQRGAGQWSGNNNATHAVISTLHDNRVWGSGQTVLGTVQIQGFDSSGFDLYLRDVTGTAITVGYMAIKFSGISAKVTTCASPTSTGTHTCTGAGFTPQLALALQGEWAAVNTQYGSDDNEPFAFGGSTATQSLVGGVYREDGGTGSVKQSLTDSKPVHSYKDGADYMVATFDSFTSDGVTWNYTTAPGSATQRGMLFIQAPADTARRRSPVFLP